MKADAGASGSPLSNDSAVYEIRGQSTISPKFGVRALFVETTFAKLRRIQSLEARNRYGHRSINNDFDAMARHPRLVFPAIPLHIIQRGNNRAPCFSNEADYLVYLTLLQQYAAIACCEIHAYVLMTNHVHLLLSSGNNDGPSKLMRRLGQHYVQYFNRRYRRTGTLWEGRFRSSLVDHERYLLICQRYIELNPVRARMVGDPGSYRWSSHRANAFGDADPLITPHLVYMGLGMHEAERRASYRHLFGDVISDELLRQIRHACNSNAPLGSASFAEHIHTALGHPPKTSRRGRPKLVEKNLPQKVL